MSIKPILFNSDMVRALLNGRKTMIRRTRGLEMFNKQPDRWRLEGDTFAFDGGFEYAPVPSCPYGQPGNLLWVRERMRVDNTTGSPSVTSGIRVKYEADGDVSDWIPYPSRLKGEPVIGKCLSYGGYREASRLTLKITDIRVERVQDISEEDAKKEGAKYYQDLPIGSVISRNNKWSMESPTNTDQGLISARMAFANYISKINNPGKILNTSFWDKNFWVWVVKFEVIKKNVDELLTQ